MKRKACALMLTAALGGCVSAERSNLGPACSGSWGQHHGPPTVPGVMGPNGQNLAMAAPYHMTPPPNALAAQRMMSNSVPLDMVQINRGANAPGMGGAPGGMSPFTPIPHGGVLTPPGVPFAPGIPAGPNVNPASMMSGMGGGVVPANVPPGMDLSGGVMLAQLAGGAPPNAGPVRLSPQRTQIRFTRPTGMKVAWFAQGPDGKPAFSNVPLEAPARYNFPQGAIYRLKISNIEGRPGLEIYPTMEVVPCNPKTEAFLAHSAVPLEFSQDDFKQIADGNYVTKVIYLPDPQFQDVAGGGTDEIVSTRLEPGADPIQEALRRGSILAILRMGNVDQEAPNTPPLGGAGPVGPAAGAPDIRPGLPTPGFMAPYPGYLPKTGALPPGGPMVAAPANPFAGGPGLPPGFNPNQLPPGFNPNLLPPGFNPGAPQAAGALPPLPIVPPPGVAPTPLTPPAPTVGTSKIEAPALPPPAPTPTFETKAPALPTIPPPAPTPTFETKAPTLPTIPQPIAPAPIAPALVTPPANDAKKTSSVTTPATPSANSTKKTEAVAAPKLQSVPTATAPKLANDTKSSAEVTIPDLPPAPPITLTGKKDVMLPPVPSLPTFPASVDLKQLDASMPPAPSFPPQPPLPLPTAVTPMSNPPLPTIPEIDGPPALPAFPATPGTIRPTTPTPSAPAGATR